jgi:SAM-dependent methyltransferase
MDTTIANVEMAKAWDGDEGDDWARDWRRYDRSVRSYHVLLLQAAAVSRGDHVLDVGCGSGESTRDAARSAADGTALGIDLSARMLARARELARAEGPPNVRFERADAQVHAFEPGAFDVVISRFGAMFFADPLAAFVNLARGLRPGGRLVMVAWQDLANNEWLRAIRGALSVGRDLPAPPAGAPGPFGLADPVGGRANLEAAGFLDVGFEAVEEPVWLGADADDAFSFIAGTGVARGLLGGLDDGARATALDALHGTMAAHQTGDGVAFGSAAWLISARLSSA